MTEDYFKEVKMFFRKSDCLVKPIILILILCGFFSSANCAYSAGLDDGPWPMFRQNISHTGQSSFTGPENPGLKWRYQTESYIYSSPVIGSDGTIYCGLKLTS